MGDKFYNNNSLLTVTELSCDLPVDLYIQDDSYFPAFGGGSKARKLVSFMEEAESKGCNAIVTAGAANSNHARTVALACARKGWRCTIVVHDIEDYTKGNLLLMKLAGAKLVFTSLDGVRIAMDNEMELFSKEGLIPYYIYGGGHALPGYKAYYKAAVDFVSTFPSIKPDYVVLASGTGGTQAGLIVGFDQLLPDTKVIGISVARNSDRGTKAVREACQELTDNLVVSSVCDNKIIFKDDWVGSGYGDCYSDMIKTIEHYSKNFGVITDPTYTGKALHGLVSMVNAGDIRPGSTVLFWHTGGLINLFQYTNKFIK